MLRHLNTLLQVNLKLSYWDAFPHFKCSILFPQRRSPISVITSLLLTDTMLLFRTDSALCQFLDSLWDIHYLSACTETPRKETSDIIPEHIHCSRVTQLGESSCIRVELCQRSPQENIYGRDLTSGLQKSLISENIITKCFVLVSVLSVTSVVAGPAFVVLIMTTRHPLAITIRKHVSLKRYKFITLHSRELHSTHGAT